MTDGQTEQLAAQPFESLTPPLSRSHRASRGLDTALAHLDRWLGVIGILATEAGDPVLAELARATREAFAANPQPAD